MQQLLTAAVKHHAECKELFNAWAAQLAQRGGKALEKGDVQRALRGAKGTPLPEAQQLQYLRQQISMRVLGCGWAQFQTRWSSSADERVGTVAHLTELLEEILLNSRSGRWRG